MIIVETVPMASSQMKKLEGTENHREVQKKETEVVWTREETRPRNRRMTDTSPPGRRRGILNQRLVDYVNRDMRGIGTIIR